MFCSLQNTFSKNVILVKLPCLIGLMILSCNVSAKTIHEIQQILPTVSLFQLGNASALFSGAIEGNMTYRELQSKGDFGLGTFNGIDGEMVALDGNFYKIRQKGETIPVDPNWKTPFVELVKFSQNKSIHLEKIDNYTILKKLIKSKLDNHNLPYAIKITGTFQFLKLRSRSPRAALQEKDVMEITYYAENMKGTLVGFWFPDYLLTLTVPEFHFHFISDNKKISGHVLELKAKYVDVSENKINQIELMFPQTRVYKDAKITAATADRYNNTQMNNSTRRNYEK